MTGSYLVEIKPDTIYVSAVHHEEIQASTADLMVTVKGSSLVSGNEALKKAKEVSQLVDALTTFGFGNEMIHLQGIHAESSSGTFLKSSSAIYRLKIRCEKLKQLADLLGIITSQKNTTLEYIDWKYADDEARERVLEHAIAKAKAKAQKVSAALGVSILGIYSFHEDDLSEGEVRMEYGIAQQETRAFGASASMDLGVDIHHSKTIKINVNIEYRVSGLE
jgi:uncharacterized protein YggE